MKNYLMTIITVSICVGIYNIISPGLHGIGKYSKMIGMLVVLCMIISPIKELINLFDDDGLQSIKDNILESENDANNEYDEIFKEYLNTFSIEEMKSEIKDILSQKYEIPSDECNIKLFTKQENGNLKISSMQILLSGKSVFKNPYILEEYFEKLLDCTCEVLIK